MAYREGVTEETPKALREFILSLGSALHRYGAPAHRLEDTMSHVCQRLGMEVRFFSTPTSIFVSFGAPSDLNTSLIRVEPGSMNLECLSRLDALANEVIAGSKTPREGALCVEQILSAPPRYGSFALIACHMLAAAGGARLFGGGIKEILVAGVSNLAIGSLAIGATRFKSISRVLEAFSAVIASACAVLAAAWFGPLSTKIATLAGIIVLLPGLTLTVAMTELATRNLNAGTSRLMGAIVVFLELGFGVALGGRLAGLFPPMVGAAALNTLPHWTEGLALVVMAMALSVLVRSRPEDWGWISVTGALAYFAARAGALWLGPELGAFVGSLVLGATGNILARLRNRPSLITTVPGILLLVPGSFGFRSLESLMDRNVFAGIDTGFSMMMIVVALVAGLLFSNALVPPRKIVL